MHGRTTAIKSNNRGLANILITEPALVVGCQSRLPTMALKIERNILVDGKYVQAMLNRYRGFEPQWAVGISQ
jgi:hypothetical protein